LAFGAGEVGRAGREGVEGIEFEEVQGGGVIPNGVGGSRQFRQVGKKKFARYSSLFFFPFSIRRKNYWRNWRDFVSACGERAEARQ
jgi:hypothetical protein